MDMDCNVLGTLNMLEAARQNGEKKFIFLLRELCASSDSWSACPAPIS